MEKSREVQWKSKREEPERIQEQVKIEGRLRLKYKMNGGQVLKEGQVKTDEKKSNPDREGSVKYYFQ